MFRPYRLVQNCLHSAAWSRRSQPRAAERRRGAAVSANDAWRFAGTLRHTPLQRSIAHSSTDGGRAAARSCNQKLAPERL